MESATAHAHHCHKNEVVSQTIIMAKTREKRDGTTVFHGASRKFIASEQARRDSGPDMRDIYHPIPSRPKVVQYHIKVIPTLAVSVSVDLRSTTVMYEKLYQNATGLGASVASASASW
jgi:hypothetical protein